MEREVTMPRISPRHLNLVWLVPTIACLLVAGCTSSATTIGSAAQNEKKATPAPTPEGDGTPARIPDEAPVIDELTAQSPHSVGGRAEEHATTRGFSLAIELSAEPRFQVFSSEDLGTAAASAPAAGSVRPGAAPPLNADLSFVADPNRVPPGMRLTLKNLRWHDLDAWEKTGLIFSYASSAVGAAYLLYAIFH